MSGGFSRSRAKQEDDWAPIHLASFRGQVKTVDRLIHNDPSKLELETEDGISSTPLLLAVLGGRLETVKLLINLGADVLARNSRGQGVIELAALGLVCSGYIGEKDLKEDEIQSTEGVEGAELKEGLNKEQEESRSRGKGNDNKSDEEEEIVVTEIYTLNNVELRVKAIPHGNTVELLEYFENFQHPELNLWGLFGQLLRFVTDSELDHASNSILLFLDRPGSTLENCRHEIIHSGFAENLIQSLNRTSSAYSKIKLLTIWSRLMSNSEIVEDSLLSRIEGHVKHDVKSDIAALRHIAAESNLSGILVLQMKTVQRFLLDQYVDCYGKVSGVPEACNIIQHLSAMALCDLCTSDRKLAESADSHGALAVISEILSYPFNDDCLTATVDALTSIISAGVQYQNEFGQINNSVRHVVNLYLKCDNRELQISLTRAIIQAVINNTSNQTWFLEAYIEAPLVDLVSSRVKELNNLAVEAFYRITEGRDDSERLQSTPPSLIELISRNPMPSVQVMAAKTLWWIVVKDFEKKLWAAAHLGRRKIVEFLTTMSEDLQLIGCDALEVLLRGPPSVEDSVPQPPLLVENGDVMGLVTLLKSSKESIVQAALRTLRWMMLGTGHVPRADIQTVFCTTQGLKLTSALMVHAEDQLVQAQAASTLASVCLGYKPALQTLKQETDFNFKVIIRLLRSGSEEVSVLAGEALANFSYKNDQVALEVSRQRVLGVQGIRLEDFRGLLHSDHLLIRCQAAYQVVVLAPVLCDEEAVQSTALGLELLVGPLLTAENEETQSLAAEQLARLVHCRLGIPEGIVTLGGVKVLCDLLRSRSSRVRYNSVIALGYLSFNPQARRLMLARCRKDTSLMNVLDEHTKHGEKISVQVHDDWKHYRNNFTTVK